MGNPDGAGRKALWSSRFTHGLSQEALDYSETTTVDERLVEYDLWGSIVHVLMLTRQQIVRADDARAIVRWLLAQLEAAKRGELTLDPELEDVHLNLETRLIEAVGLRVGGQMHTARSRNDQVVTDARMYVRQQILNIAREALDFVDELAAAAGRETDTVMLGYTHSQPAQPISYGFWLAAHATALLRDVGRHLSAFDRVNVNPLGSCALAGTSFDIDRDFTTTLLGFRAPMTNALDATSTRDFFLETSAAISILMSNLSRFADEVVTWSTHEFGLLHVHDEYATGSSIMPQKKNPVVAELARAKSGIALGSFAELFTVTKSVDLGYSCDLQQDKPALWRAIDAAISTTSVLRNQFLSTSVVRERGMRACWDSFSTATELANELVRTRDLPFREAYRVVGEIVRTLGSEGLGLDASERVAALLRDQGVSMDAEAIRTSTDPGRVMRTHSSAGGTAPSAVEAGLLELSRESNGQRAELEARSDLISRRLKLTLDTASAFAAGDELPSALEGLALEAREVRS